MKLPEVDKSTPLFQLLTRRKSIRRYKDKPLGLNELSRILWATYGFVNGRRTAPSAGAIYPIEIYVVVKNVVDLKPGIYKYIEKNHELELVKEGDYSRKLANACLGQGCVLMAPLNIVITAMPEKVIKWYGERGYRYIYMEAGHIGQNIYLVATEMNLGTVAVGAFNDDAVREVIGLGREYMVLYIFPIGIP
ncbi:MAG: SagB/ThcOx family dehydrogenase [Desulfurococcaceae archaeon]